MVSGQNICNEVQSLLPAYSIGATDPQETAFVERHLPECPELAIELAEYMDLAEAMLYIPPSVGANATRLPDVLDIRPHLQHNIPEPPTASSAPDGSPALLQRGASNRPQQRPWIVWLGAAVIVILLGFNIFWLAQISALNERLNAEVVARIEAQNALTIVTNQRADTQRIGANLSHSIFDEAVNGHGAVLATLTWDTETRFGSFHISGLNSAEEGHAYHLWLTREGHSINVGKLEVNDQRIGALIFHSDEPVDEYTQFLITTDALDAPTSQTPENHLLAGRI